MKKLFSLLLALVASMCLSKAAIIEVDGDFADWDAVPAHLLSKSSVDDEAKYKELYNIKFCTDADFIYFFMEYNGGVYAYLDENDNPTVGNIVEQYDIYLNVDADEKTGFDNETWRRMGADFLIEANIPLGDKQIYAYMQEGNDQSAWTWENLDKYDAISFCAPVVLANEHKALEGKVEIAAFPVEIKSLKVGINVSTTEWNETGRLPELHQWAGGTNSSELLEVRLNTANNIFTKIGDLYYNLNSSNLTAEVTYQEQSDANYDGLTSIEIPSLVTYNAQDYIVTSIGSWAFRNCKTLTSAIIPNSVTIIKDNAFCECKNLTSVTIPESVITIETFAFNGCKNITEFSFSNSLQRIGHAAFAGCSSLTSLNLKNNLTEIDSWAFWGCSGLSELTIPEGITSIKDGTFAVCTGLTSLTIPSSVSFIGWQAFWGCDKLTKVTNNATTPQVIKDAKVFDGDEALSEYPVDKAHCLLLVPESSIDLYAAADEWKDFIIRGVGQHAVSYVDKDDALLHSEEITLHLPVAPAFTDFTFIKWVVVASDLADGIKIQAIYEYTGGATPAPSTVVNPKNAAQKLIRNGNVYILTDEHTYTVTGQEIK